MIKILAAAVVSLAVGAGASAQVDDLAASGSTMAGTMHSSGIPVGWEGEVGNAFYGQGGVLLPADEIRANWADLEAEDKALVVDDCDRFAQAGSAAGAAVEQSSVADSPVAEPRESLAPLDEENVGYVEPEEVEAPGTENYGLTGDPHFDQLMQLCAFLAEL